MKIDLEKFLGGEIQKQFNEQLKRILKDIQDPKTDATQTRSITMKLAILPNSSRDRASVKFESKTNLARLDVFTALMGLKKEKGQLTLFVPDDDTEVA